MNDNKSVTMSTEERAYLREMASEISKALYDLKYDVSDLAFAAGLPTDYCRRLVEGAMPFKHFREGIYALSGLQAALLIDEPMPFVTPRRAPGIELCVLPTGKPGGHEITGLADFLLMLPYVRPNKRKLTAAYKEYLDTPVLLADKVVEILDEAVHDALEENHSFQEKYSLLAEQIQCLKNYALILRYYEQRHLLNAVVFLTDPASRHLPDLAAFESELRRILMRVDVMARMLGLTRKDLAERTSLSEERLNDILNGYFHLPTTFELMSMLWYGLRIDPPYFRSDSPVLPTYFSSDYYLLMFPPAYGKGHTAQSLLQLLAYYPLMGEEHIDALTTSLSAKAAVTPPVWASGAAYPPSLLPKYRRSFDVIRLDPLFTVLDTVIRCLPNSPRKALAGEWCGQLKSIGLDKWQEKVLANAYGLQRK